MCLTYLTSALIFLATHSAVSLYSAIFRQDSDHLPRAGKCRRHVLLQMAKDRCIYTYMVSTFKHRSEETRLFLGSSCLTLWLCSDQKRRPTRYRLDFTVAVQWLWKQILFLLLLLLENYKCNLLQYILKSKKRDSKNTIISSSGFAALVAFNVLKASLVLDILIQFCWFF